MARRKAIVESTMTPPPVVFERVYEMEAGNFTIEKGDLIKIVGEYGMRFKFVSVTTNTKTGATWVDCHEVHRGQTGAFRSFTLDRVKRIPKRRTKKAVKKSV
jgi:predicted molibdopterin-dependent oxidoreductase YjgC